LSSLKKENKEKEEKDLEEQLNTFNPSSRYPFKKSTFSKPSVLEEHKRTLEILKTMAEAQKKYLAKKRKRRKKNEKLLAG